MAKGSKKNNPARPHVIEPPAARHTFTPLERHFGLLRAVRRKPSAGKTAAWIEAEIGRLKAASRIRPDVRISSLARLLEEQMKRAAKADPTLRPVAWRHIKNMLPEWGLWPLS